MIYMRMKSHKNLQRTSENIMISIKYRKKIYTCSKNQMNIIQDIKKYHR